jgi:hypothetical protein
MPFLSSTDTFRVSQNTMFPHFIHLTSDTLASIRSSVCEVSAILVNNDLSSLLRNHVDSSCGLVVDEHRHNRNVHYM